MSAPLSTESDAATTVPSGVAATAFWTAACRAAEAERDTPLVVDPFAAMLAGEQGLAIGRALEREGHAHGAIVVRTRMIDDRIAAAVVVDGVRRVAVLGAGLDARPFRLALPSGVTWTEVDLPELVAWKRARLSTLSRPPVEHALHAVDLRDGGALEGVLAGEERLLVVLEGVLPYLAPAEADALLAVLARAGARIVCDLGGGTWGATAGRRIARVVAGRGAPFRTRIREPRAFFAARGFRVLSDVSLVDWDESRGDRRFRAPWSSRLLPGYRDAARVVDVTPARSS